MGDLSRSLDRAKYKLREVEGTVDQQADEIKANWRKISSLEKEVHTEDLSQVHDKLDRNWKSLDRAHDKVRDVEESGAKHASEIKEHKHKISSLEEEVSRLETVTERLALAVRTIAEDPISELVAEGIADE